MIEMKKLTSMLAAETADDKWWDGLSKKEQQAYLKAHPGSKYGGGKGTSVGVGGPMSGSKISLNKAHEHAKKHGWRLVDATREDRTYKHNDLPGHQLYVDKYGGFSHTNADDVQVKNGSSASVLGKHLDKLHGDDGGYNTVTAFVPVKNGQPDAAMHRAIHRLAAKHKFEKVGEGALAEDSPRYTRHDVAFRVPQSKVKEFRSGLREAGVKRHGVYDDVL